MAINKKQVKILKKLKTQEGSGLTQQKLADKLGCHRSTISYHLTKSRNSDSTDRSLESLGFVDVTKEGRKKFYDITSKGIRELNNLEDSGTYPEIFQQSSNNQGGSVPNSEVHNFSASCEILNREMLAENFREVAVKKSDREWNYDETSDEYFSFVDKLKVRLTGGKVIVRLEDRVSELDSVVAKNRALDLIEEGFDWVDENLNFIELSDEVRIVRQHIAIGDDSQGCPLAKFIDEETDMRVKDFSVEVEDKSGKKVERIWMDKSHGDKGQTEMGNSPGQNRDYAEDDASRVEDLLRSLIEDEFTVADLKDIGDVKESLNLLVKLKLVEQVDSMDIGGSSGSSDRFNKLDELEDSMLDRLDSL